ncbi:MAG: transcription-repair coupling factor [Anaerolineaceae bacterium]|nr:transcription-repair coupling factor [Anaerolineaceae bacterium]
MLEAIQNHPDFKSLIDLIETSSTHNALGLIRSVRLPMLASLKNTLDRPIVFIVERMDQAIAIADELGFWMKTDGIILFPEPSPTFYENAAWGSLTRRDRLQTLTFLANYHLPGSKQPDQSTIIITTVRGLMTRTIPRRDFLKAIRTVKVGQLIKQEELVKEWVENGYQSSEIVIEPGFFSRRGGLLDIWSVADQYPVRIDFFGNEIESIRQFDPATQRTLRLIEGFTISPASEVLLSKAQQLGIETQNLNEFSIPLLYPFPASLLDYLPKKALVILDDKELIRTIANDIEEQAVRFRMDSITEGIINPDFPLPYLPWSEIEDVLSVHPWIDFGFGFSEESPLFEKTFSHGERFGGRIKTFLDYLEEKCTVGVNSVIVSRQLNRIKSLWSEHQCQKKQPSFIEGSLSEGWVLRNQTGEEKHLLITDSEIFGWDRPQPRKRPRPVVHSPEVDYSDLQVGDWVVHVDFGIGKFIGLVQRFLEGMEREFLCVEYDGGDQLFVPIHQADRLGRYVGPDGSAPSPTRLGTQEWTNAKTKVREAVQEIAKELLELYARRKLAVGTSFSADTVWQQELEASFPYIETEDQKKAIVEVKTDMESIRPMDRLLCGDVGYGKTEVALRAAFKAVMDGKQVAILVPTTVLAQQHYETFRERLAPFPVNVEMLSRFRSHKEQDEIVLKMAFGEIDIVIGTHRLLSKDIAFKDIGLVIIDEEQRFGVSHKEFFKRLRTELDVLTLTATPIPRTLYMALTGVRDISIINTPPAERQPVVTHIGPYSPSLVRQAILRELERGGQVFFVHNRVQTIAAMKSHLNKLVPEARIDIGHGQMNEGELSRVMQSFNNGDIDVLLCTSIIESGLDIPNANTLIVDRGDAFGLAQLYQLRGRVGRGAQRAYAYFFRHRKKQPTLDGQERLETIAEYTQLGSGYSIAMRDLEMRGAGELLGTRQHGAIASVGYHLYTRLLAQSVKKLKSSDHDLPVSELQKIKHIRMPVAVDLPLTIGLPIDYITDQRMRLSLYRRIAEIETLEALDALNNEFEDRFGPIPEEVKNLIFQIKVKILAEKAGLSSLGMESDQMVLRYPSQTNKQILRELPIPGNFVRSGKDSYWFAFRKYGENWQDMMILILNQLGEFIPELS